MASRGPPPELRSHTVRGSTTTCRIIAQVARVQPTAVHDLLDGMRTLPVTAHAFRLRPVSVITDAVDKAGSSSTPLPTSLDGAIDEQQPPPAQLMRALLSTGRSIQLTHPLSLAGKADAWVRQPPA